MSEAEYRERAGMEDGGDGFTPKPSDEEVQIFDLLSRIPRSKGYYLKLYKGAPNERRFMLQEIENYDSWETDIETEVRKLVEANPWNLGPHQKDTLLKDRTGIYSLFIYQKGRAGHVPGEKPLVFNFVFAPEGPAVAAPAGNDIQESLKAVTGMMTAFKEAGLVNTQNNGGPDVAKTMGDAFRAGIDVMKTAIPANPGQSNMEKLLERLLDKLDSKPKEKSPLEELMEKKLLDSLTREPEKKDLVDEITRIRELASVINPSGEPVEGPSVLGKALEQFMPMLPGILAKIADPINQLILLKREQIAYQYNSGKAPQAPQAPQVSRIEGADAPAAGTPTSPDAPAAAPLAPTQEEEDVNLLAAMSLVKKLKKMIDVGDRNFENVLDGLKFAFGGEVVDHYCDGMIKREDLIAGLQRFDKFFTLEGPVAYCNEFFDWVDKEIKTSVYICNQCGTEDELTFNDFMGDPACGECEHGIMQLKKDPAIAAGNGNGGH
ncbi:MAG: hypothetical protein M0Z52_07390 [Actinomycetota bacterium]|nr:hypothetical protein [Actinomycetota bacterium]